MKGLSRTLGAAFVATALLLSGCQQAEAAKPPPAAAGATVQVAHSKGTAEVPAAPQRVVVFDLSSLDTLEVLGVKVHAVAGSIFPKRLERYQGEEYPKVGTLFEPDYEALNAVQPDLIIVGGRSSAKYEELGKLAPAIDLSISDESYLASARQNALTLAKVFGKTELAQEKLKALDATVETLAAQASGAGKALIVLTTGGKMSAYGPGSRFGTLHTDFGFTPAADNLKTGRHGEPISFEFIAKTDPDWLFIIDRDAAIGEKGAGASALLDNPLVKETSAGRKGRIVYLDPADWYLAGGGLGALQAMADQVSEALATPR